MGCARFNIDTVTKFLEKNLEFLVKHIPLANAHMSAFLTDQYWETFLTDDIKTELLSFTDEQLKHLAELGRNEDSILKTPHNRTGADETTKPLLDEDKLEDEIAVPRPDMNIKVTAFTESKKFYYRWHHDGVLNFCKDAWSNTIEGQGLAVSVEELFTLLDMAVNDRKEFVSAFMDTKKSHEVDIMSYVCVHLFKSTGCKLTVDVGSGKGYLGQNLSLQHKLPVLGIDAVSSNSVAASKRLDSIGKQWEGISRNVDNEQKGIKLTKKQKKELKSKQKLHSLREKRSGIDKELIDEKVKSFPLKKVVSPTNGAVRSSKDEAESKCDPSVKCGTSECLLMEKSEDLNSDCGSYVPLTMFVNTETDLKAIAKESFPFLSCDNSARTKLTAIPESESCDQCEHLIENNSADSNDGFNTDLEKHDLLQAESDKTSRPHAKTKTSIDIDKKHEQDVDDIGIMLTGLHTCGDLASSMLELFVTNPDIKSLCSVGCCYHLLSEEFGEEELNAGIEGPVYGFPKSSYLKEKKVRLGNTARNLASQALHKMSSFEKLQGYRFFPRALLQKIIEDVVDPGSIKWSGLRKLEQRSSGIKDYIQKACRKLDIPDELVSEELIEDYIQQYGESQRHLAAFFQLKTVLAPCIESLILLDRVCFLLEQATVKEVFLVKLFDPIISPRCYGIVATKR